MLLQAKWCVVTSAEAPATPHAIPALPALGCRRPGAYDVRRVKQVEVHPDFTANEPQQNNLALVVLDKASSKPLVNLPAGGRLAAGGRAAEAGRGGAPLGSSTAAAAAAVQHGELASSCVQAMLRQCLSDPPSYSCRCSACSHVSIPFEQNAGHISWVGQPDQRRLLATGAQRCPGAAALGALQRAAGGV